MIKDRLKEPSTWAGLAILLAQAGKLVAPQYGFIFDFVSMAVGGGAVVIPEKRYT